MVSVIRLHPHAAAAAAALTCSAAAAEATRRAVADCLTSAPAASMSHPALARGVAVIRYRTENLRIIGVWPGALDVSPGRICISPSTAHRGIEPTQWRALIIRACRSDAPGPGPARDDPPRSEQAVGAVQAERRATKPVWYRAAPPRPGSPLRQDGDEPDLRPPVDGFSTTGRLHSSKRPAWAEVSPVTKAIRSARSGVPASASGRRWGRLLGHAQVAQHAS
jgi:hypothetical protein